MSTPDFLDSLDKMPTRETVAELKPEPAAEVEETEEEEVEEQEEAEVEQEQESEQVEKPAATTAASEPKDAAALKTGMIAERKKRQESEATVKALEKRLRELEARSAPVREQVAPVDFYQNPEGFVAQVEQRLQVAHLNALAADMREQHEDFDEVTQAAIDVMNTNPQLAAEIQARVRNAGNPAREAYRIGKELMAAKKEAELLKDPAAYKASIRDEVLAEIRAELAANPAPKVTLPRDLSNGRSGADQVANTPPVDPRRGGFDSLFDHRPRQT